MTEEELREWRQWLLEEGKEPRSISTPRSLAGSAFEYDKRTGQVFECGHDGSRHMIAIQDGQITRVEERPRESLKHDLRLHIRIFAMVVMQGLVFLSLIALHQGLNYLTGRVIPSGWHGPVLSQLDATVSVIFGVGYLAILVDTLVAFVPVLRHWKDNLERVPCSKAAEQKRANVPFFTDLLIRILVGS